jgi:hypothetical protein
MPDLDDESTIPGADNTFEDLPAITGKRQAKLAEFILRHMAELAC